VTPVPSTRRCDEGRRARSSSDPASNVAATLRRSHAESPDSPCEAAGRHGRRDHDVNGGRRSDGVRSDEALIKVGLPSVDQTIRMWMNDAPGYLPPIGIGDVIRASGAGVVVESISAR
jgi:hypothetical protein